jgi:hypothetical protein
MTDKPDDVDLDFEELMFEGEEASPLGAPAGGSDGSDEKASPTLGSRTSPPASDGGRRRRASSSASTGRSRRGSRRESFYERVRLVFHFL